MSFYCKFDPTGKSQIQGDGGVANFITVCESRKYTHRPATTKEDTQDHIDIFVNGWLDHETSIDIKARKALKRGWPPQDEKLLLEYTNVAGKNGWLRGRAEFISFDQLARIILAKREELLTLWNTKVDMTKLSETSQDSLYKLYTRAKWGRLDVTSLVMATDILALPGTIVWEK